MSDTVVKRAKWVGPFPTVLPDGTVLVPGDEYDISPEQALSAHWQVVEAKTVPAPKPAKGDD